MANPAPNPGSDLAIDMGCTCPILDNGHGRGAWWGTKEKTAFWIDESCVIHGKGYFRQEEENVDEQN